MNSLLQSHRSSFLTVAYAALGALLLSLALLGKEAAWARSDASNFHMEYVEKVSKLGVMAALREPSAAMPPFFHLVVAEISNRFRISAYTTGTAVSLISTLLFFALISRESQSNEPLSKVKWPLFVVIGFSWPLLSASLSPVTDAFAILLYSAILVCSLREQFLPLLVLLPAIVFTRQYYLVIVAALAVSLPLRLTLKNYDGKALDQLGPAAVLASAILAAVLVAALFYSTWGGMVPARFRSYHTASTAINLGAITLALCYVGAVVAANIALQVYRPKAKNFLYALPAGLLLYVSLPTDYNLEAGRWGSIFWQAARLQDFVGLNVLSLICLVFFAIFLIERIIWHMEYGINYQSALSLLVMTGIACAFALQPFAWQRYIDPMLGIATTIYIATAGFSENRGTDRLCTPTQGAIRG